jgi:hypothetical protein
MLFLIPIYVRTYALSLTLNTCVRMVYYPRVSGYGFSRMLVCWQLGQLAVHSDFDFCMALYFVEKQVRGSDERAQITKYCH